MSEKKALNKKWIKVIVPGIVVLLLAGICWYFFSKNNEDAEETVQVEYREVFNQLEFSGTIEPRDMRSVYSVVNQLKITDVCVKNGDFVHAGDVLVLLDSTDIEYEIKKNELVLEQTKLEYENNLLTAQTAVNVGKKEAVVSKSEAVKVAQAEYDSILKRYEMAMSAYQNDCTAEIVAAKNELREAYVNLDVLPEDDFEGRSVKGTEVTSAQERLNAARTAAKKEADLLQLDLTKAEAALNAAKAEYSAAEGTSKYEKAELQSKASILEGSNQIEQAELELEKRKNDLENYTIKAPCDGYVSELSIKIGDTTDGKALMKLLDYEGMKIVIDVDEYDIKDFQIGDEVRIYVPSLDTYYDGTVDMKATQATQKNELSYIQVTIAFEPDQMISSGLGATVYTIPGEDVYQLAIPSYCLNYDMATGEHYVYVQTQGEEEYRIVEVGNSDGEYTAILSGLSEGEIVIPQ